MYFDVVTCAVQIVRKVARAMLLNYQNLCLSQQQLYTNATL